LQNTASNKTIKQISDSINIFEEIFLKTENNE